MHFAVACREGSRQQETQHSIILSSTPQPSTTFQRPRKRSTSSHSWLQRPSKDPHVQKARDLSLPSRAYFKLQQINETLLSVATKSPKRRLIQSNMRIVDLGAAPGGWSIYASTQLDPTLGGAVVAVDLLPLSPEVLSRMHRGLGGSASAFLRENSRGIASVVRFWRRSPSSPGRTSSRMVL